MMTGRHGHRKYHALIQEMRNAAMNLFIPEAKYVKLGIVVVGVSIMLIWLIVFPTNTQEVALVPTNTPTATITDIATERPSGMPVPTVNIAALFFRELSGATEQPTGTPIPTNTRTPTPTDTPTPTNTPAPTDAPHIVSYSAYTVAPGDTIQNISQRSGSESDLLLTYNHLTNLPPIGQPLIIPHLIDQPNMAQSEPVLIIQGNSAQLWVALTLDAGAGSEPVPSILATLRERGIHITFFLTGNWIQSNPDLARQIVADGHEIANHSLSHPDFRFLSDAQIVEELAATETLMQEITGVSTRPFFRPPLGAYDKRVLLTVANAGYLPIYWTLDSLDSIGEPKTPAFLVERVTETLPPEELAGAIILAHCGSEATAQALPEILDRFAAMGFGVRMLSEVLDA